jgi:RNA polymerase sigma factor for flagellar operon FliA
MVIGASAADIAALWDAFTQHRDAGLRARLVGQYLGFARMLAAKMFANRTHMEVEFDEYLQFARVGLVEAVDRYEPARGFKFETFAASRINGAILNGMMEFSEVHAQVAARKRIVHTRLESLKDGRSEARGGDGLFAYLAELAIGLAVGFTLEHSGMYRDNEEAAYPDNTYSGVELRQLRHRLNGFLAELPPKQRLVLTYHYQQQISFEEIARMLQLSKGRIAQIHKEALGKLRDAMDRQRTLDWSG